MKVIFNPRCTKCRILNKALEDKQVTWERVLYLEGALDRALVKEIFESFKGEWQQLIRSKEKLFKEQGLKLKDLSRAEAMKLVLKHPVLLQRPIVLHNGEAIIARDDETVSKLV